MAFPEMPSFGLQGKRALVTGGSRGLGFACAVALAQSGAEVWIAARDRQALDAAATLAAERGMLLRPVALDITDVAQVEAVTKALPAFDILVNSAGLARHEPFLTVSEANFDAVMAINLRATFFVSQRIAARMREERIAGSIIHISSQMGHVGGLSAASTARPNLRWKG